MNTEKLKTLKTFELSYGKHKNIEDGACIMEMVSWFADEPWSDHPKCACPILTAYAINLNDRFNTEHRQRLKEFIPVLVGTKRTDETQIARKRLLMWRNVTVTFPIVLDFIKLPELADELRKFENTLESMAQASNFLVKNKEAIKKTANAYAYTDADAYAYAYTDAYDYAYANDSADANAYATAAAYADADAYAYAYALRQKIADVAIETLRLALEIK